MPRAKKPLNQRSSNGDSGMPTIVNVNLSDEQKMLIKSNVPAMKALWEAVEEWTADNYKMTVSYDDTTDCYAVYLIGKGEQTTNAGMMLAGYAPTLSGAIAVLLYKHQVVCEGDWGKRSQANNENAWR